MAVWGSALLLAAVQVIGTFGAGHDQVDRKPVDALAVVLVLVGPAALAWRERWPLLPVLVAVAAADVYVAVGYPYGPIFASVAISLFTAVQAVSRRVVWPITAAGYVGFIAAMVVDARRRDSVGLGHLALVAGWVLVVLAVAEVARIRREQAAEIARTAEEEEQRRATEQRLALARDLHDVLAHNISLINVQASVALHLLDEHPEQARPALASIKDASRGALHELRTALDILRHGEGVPLAPAPRLADLRDLVAGVEAGGLRVELEQEDRAEVLPTSVELAAYRIVQEALTNVTRHARARTVRVTLRSVGEDLRLEVQDDGVGGEVHAGNGISGMRERAAALGGSLDAGPCVGGGFRVAATIPVPR
jgi:signal transduction histidine kinase